eukprot:38296_1
MKRYDPQTDSTRTQAQKPVKNFGSNMSQPNHQIILNSQTCSVDLTIPTHSNMLIFPPTQHDSNLSSQQNHDPCLLIIKRYLKTNRISNHELQSLPIETQLDLKHDRYSMQGDLLLYKKEDIIYKSVVLPRPPISNHHIPNTNNHNSASTNVITRRTSSIIFLQNSDPYLRTIKHCLMYNDATYLCTLPHSMRIDVLSHGYCIKNNLLYFHNGLIVPKQPLRPTAPPYALSPIVTYLSQKHEPNPNYPIDICTSHAISPSVSSGHTSVQAEQDQENDESEPQCTKCWCCVHCGKINWNQFCVQCKHSRHDNEINESSRGLYDLYHKHHRIKNVNGMTFYAQTGDKLRDYKGLKGEPSHFKYDQTQSILVCGECDFSFTACLVRLRDTGINTCCTSWYYYQSQWCKGMARSIGKKRFSVFENNLAFCTRHGVNVTFGIDVKWLKSTEKDWNGIGVDTFDRFIFTFPRTYNEKRNHKWNKIRYYNENQMLLMNILESAKYYLSQDGEIHLMLLKGQFYNFKIAEVLRDLKLEILYWCELNEGSLDTHYNSYVPRDCFGNPMKINDSVIHFCSLGKITNVEY